ncbi:polymorphic outer membrane protein middle domain-containing protein [Chlamydia suis]|uniref:polymorphic outer membrane protein middle domain-containing protein n=1 Tax=Chlamydia suis TaxID=83559 RepID=UPI0009E4BC92|nr:polymorphic outer membrane protein middle domain-containing protein [Chlamydia suis]
MKKLSFFFFIGSSLLGIAREIPSQIFLVPTLVPAPTIGSVSTSSSLIGDTHNLTECHLDNLRYILASLQKTPNKGAVITVTDYLRFLDTQNEGIYFFKNLTPESGGVIGYTNPNHPTVEISDTVGPVIFENNTCFRAINRVQGDEAGNRAREGGAINASNIFINHNLGVVGFIKNFSYVKGGAISADTFSVKENQSCVLFMDNICIQTNTAGKGGAIHANTSNSFEKNNGDLLFVNNACCAGGAIFTPTCSLTGNRGNIIFYNNRCFKNVETQSNEPPDGGAIKVTTRLDITGNSGRVFFCENLTKNCGGAIYAPLINLVDNGPTYFMHNIANNKGGAIYITGTETSKISADRDAVIFNNNIVANVTNEAGTSTADNPPRRNALTIDSSSGGIELGAGQNQNLIFYDPIQITNAGVSVDFNKNSSQTGAVVFSGATVNSADFSPINLQTKTPATLTLSNGLLCIEDHAQLTVNKFTQNGGIVALGNGAVLSSYKNGNNTSASVTLNHIGLNLPSILKDGADIPTLWVEPTSSSQSNSTTYTADTSSTFSLNGAKLSLIDENGNSPYESTDLSHALSSQPMLAISEASENQMQSESMDFSSVNVPHYGWQGLWTWGWAKVEDPAPTNQASVTDPEKANRFHRTLLLTWLPAGYVPSPKHKSPLIANTLWGNMLLATESLKNTSGQELLDRPFWGITGGGLGMMVYQDPRKNHPGFHMRTSGYSAGMIAGQTHTFSLRFSQAYTKLNERYAKNYVSSKNYSCQGEMLLSLQEGFLLTKLIGLYSYGDHSSHHFYTQGENLLSQGKFQSQTLGGAVFVDLPLKPFGTSNLLTAPFLGAVGIYSSLSSFSEEGAYPRSFATKTPLVNVLIPIGVKGNFMNASHRPQAWTVELAYQPVLYRQEPKISTQLLASKGIWFGHGSPSSRHAMAYKISQKTQLLRFATLQLQYHGFYSSSTFCNYLNGEMSLRF